MVDYIHSSKYQKIPKLEDTKLEEIQRLMEGTKSFSKLSVLMMFYCNID